MHTHSVDPRRPAENHCMQSAMFTNVRWALHSCCRQLALVWVSLFHKYGFICSQNRRYLNGTGSEDAG